MTKQLLLLMLCFITMSSIEAQTPKGQTPPVITAKDKINIQQFKSLQGSNRVEAFKKIQPLILINDGVKIGQADKMGVLPTSKIELQKIVGAPDKIIDGDFWEYNLKSNRSSCMAVFGFDQNDFVVFVTIKNCN